MVDELEADKPIKANLPPNPTTLTNLVTSLTGEQRKKIALDCIDQYEWDVQSLTGWEEKRNNWYKLWACHRDEKNDPWEGASNVCIPMLATAANQFSGRSYQTVFAAPGIVKAMPVGALDRKRARNVEQFMNFQTMHEMEEYEEVFDKVLLNLPINGTAFKKAYWDVENVRPRTEYISATDLILPYKTKSMETARRITHKVYLHYEEILDRKEDGKYEFVDLVAKTVGEEQDKPAIKDTVDDIQGTEKIKSEDEPHLILEVHKTIDIGKGRKPYIFTVDHDSATLLRVSSRTFRGKTLNYFTDYHFLPNTEGFYSFGFGHFLEPLNEMANTAFNQIFDAGKISNLPFGFYSRKAGIKKGKIKLAPGGMYEVNDPKQVYFPSMRGVDQVLFQVLGLIQQYMEQFTSTSDYLSGRESKGTKTPTAHGTLAIIEQGLVTFAVMTKRIHRSLRKELRLLFSLNSIHLPDSKEYRIMESEQDIAFSDIKKADFDGKFDIMPIGDPSFASKTIRKQEALEKYQLLLANPLIIGNPELGMPPNKRAIWEVTSDYLEALEAKNKNKLLPPIPEEPISPEEENAMFAQGDKVEPKQGEDHNNHLTVHLNFADGELFNTMPEKFQDLLEEHVIATQNIARSDQALQEQLGGIPGQAPQASGGEPPPQQAGQ